MYSLSTNAPKPVTLMPSGLKETAVAGEATGASKGLYSAKKKKAKTLNREIPGIDQLSYCDLHQVAV